MGAPPLIFFVHNPPKRTMGASHDISLFEKNITADGRNISAASIVKEKKSLGNLPTIIFESGRFLKKRAHDVPRVHDLKK